MDTAAIERAGTAPLAGLLNAAASAHDVPALVTAIVALQRAGVDTGLPLTARANPTESAHQPRSTG